MAHKKIFFPHKTFDDDLDAFSQLASAAGWTFSGVDRERIVLDASEQRAERARLDALVMELGRVRTEFALAQEARYQRFIAMLNAARGAFGRNQAVMAQLARFRRPRGRRAKTTPETR
jgi:hypothetical protein